MNTPTFIQRVLRSIVARLRRLAQARWVLTLAMMLTIGLCTTTLTFVLVGRTHEAAARSMNPGAPALVAEPIVSRYVRWIRGVVRSGFTDWGRSVSTPSVNAVLIERLPVTLRVGLATWVLVWVSSLGLAIVLASKLRRLGRWHVRWIHPTLQALPTLPLVFLAFVLVARSGLARSSASREIAAILVQSAILLPATIALWFNGISRITSQEYIRVARAKGVAPLRLWVHHVIPNTLVTSGLLSQAAFSLAGLLVGSVFIESVFFLGGVGPLFVGAVTKGQCELAATASLMYFVPLSCCVLLSEAMVLGLGSRKEDQYGP